MSRKNRAKRLTLVFLALALACNRLLNVLADDAWVWRAHDLTLSASVAFAVTLAFLHAPYGWLRTKCLLAALTGVCAVDLACVAFNASGSYGYWLLAQITLGALAALTYLMRCHGTAIPAVDPTRLVCLRAVPRSPQDLAISLVGAYGSDGGYALCADGFVYRYRRGVLVKQAVALLPPNRYHASTGARITPSVLSELNALVGQRWTWRRNCLTVLRPIWRRHCG